MRRKFIIRKELIVGIELVKPRVEKTYKNSNFFEWLVGKSEEVSVGPEIRIYTNPDKNPRWVIKKNLITDAEKEYDILKNRLENKDCNYIEIEI